MSRTNMLTVADWPRHLSWDAGIRGGSFEMGLLGEQDSDRSWIWREKHGPLSRRKLAQKPAEGV